MERKEPVPDKKAKRLRLMKIIQTVLTVAVNVFFVMYLCMIIKLAASDGGFTKTSAAMMVFEYFFGYLPASLMLLILLVFNLALTHLFVRGWEISAAAVIANRIAAADRPRLRREKKKETVFSCFRFAAVSAKPFPSFFGYYSH